MNSIFQNIKVLRLQKGWKQQEIARRLNISIPAFSKLENGVTDIKLSRLGQLASVLDIPITKLACQKNTDLQAQSISEAALDRKLSVGNAAVFHLQQEVIQLHEAIWAYDRRASREEY